MLLNIDNLEDKPSTENSREGNNKEVINYHSLMDLDKSDSLGNKKYVDILEDKVKISIRFRGREMAHQDIGRKQLERIIEDTAEISNVEQHPKMEGRQMGMLLGPKKKK